MASIIGRVVGMAGRERLRSFATGGTNDVALRYDEIREWDPLLKFMLANIATVQLYDGQEWFILELEESDVKSEKENSG
jgi:hypothetical protein